MDEVSEFDTREVAQAVCPFAPAAASLATARPMSMAYYLQVCGARTFRSCRFTTRIMHRETEI
jgi:hypothetical protein